MFEYFTYITVEEIYVHYLFKGGVIIIIKYNVYTANVRSKDISVVDTTINELVNSIYVGDQPRFLTISPDTKYAYVSVLARDLNQNFNSYVSVIDLITNKIISNITVGGLSNNLAITPDGKYVYVPNSGGYISVIDTSINDVIDIIRVPSRLSASAKDIIITSDGRFAYVTSQYNGYYNAILTIDIPSNIISSLIYVNREIWGIDLTSDERFIFTVNSVLNEVYQIDMINKSVVNTINVIGNPIDIALSLNGRYAYTTNYPLDNVSVIDLYKNSIIGTIDVGLRPLSISLAPDGKLIYVTNTSSNFISVIDSITNNLIGDIEVGNRPMGIAFSKKLSIQDKINAIIKAIQKLIAKGILEKGEGNSIIVKLKTVNSHLDKSNNKTAINLVEIVIKEINRLINLNKLPSDLGRDLIQSLEIIKSEIEIL